MKSSYNFKDDPKPMKSVISSEDVNEIRLFTYIPFDMGQDCSETRDGEELSTEDQLAELVRQKEEIIEQANAEAEFIRQNAFQQGYEEGYKAGIEKSRKDIEVMMDTLQKAIAELNTLRNSILENAENDIIHLTIRIAEKIVGRELQQHPDSLISLIKKAITMLKPEGQFTLRLNPKDRKIFEDSGLEISAIFGGNNSIRIEEDPNITPGGCLLIGNTSVIDLTYESRLDSVVGALDEDGESGEANTESL